MRVALLTIAVLAIAACQQDTTPADSTASQPAAAAQADEFAYVEAGIANLQGRMARGALSSHQLTQAYLDRIASIDKAGPALNAVIELNPDALKEADAFDAERKAGRVRMAGPQPPNRRAATHARSSRGR